MSNPTFESILRESALGDQIRSHERQKENEQKQQQESVEAYKKRQAITQSILAEWAQKFPKAFGSIKIPLKIGVKDDLLAAYENSSYSKAQIRLALKSYLSSYQYYSSMLNHKKRHDLNGEFVEDIAEEHLAHAAKQIAFLKKQFEAAKLRKSSSKNSNGGRARVDRVRQGASESRASV